MDPMARAHLVPLLAAAALAAACEPLAEHDYPGEPLLTVSGRVTGTAPLPPIEAAILWQLGPPPTTSEQELATRVPVETSPAGPAGPTGPAGSGGTATFTLRLYQPPPDGALRTLRDGEVAWVRGNAGAVPLGIAADAAPALPTSGSTSYGVDVGHWIVWLATDVPQGSLTAWWLGGALSAGYHVVRVKPVDPVTVCADLPALDACVATLVSLGVADDGTYAADTARGFCTASYRLEPAPPGEELALGLGTYAPPEGGGPCP